jgi:hypothetical protein
MERARPWSRRSPRAFGFSADIKVGGRTNGAFSHRRAHRGRGRGRTSVLTRVRVPGRLVRRGRCGVNRWPALRLADDGRLE